LLNLRIEGHLIFRLKVSQAPLEREWEILGEMAGRLRTGVAIGKRLGHISEPPVEAAWMRV